MPHSVHAYRKPRLCINIHHYAPPIGFTAQRALTAQRAAARCAAHRAASSLAAARRCGVGEGSMSSFKWIT